VKGSPVKGAPRVQIAYPDSERKDRHAGARGEIPILMINGDTLKDTADKMLTRTDPGGGRVNFPTYLPDTFYTELCVEIKTPKGWQNPKNFRNESWDLFVYAIAGAISRHIGIEHIDWEAPPSWADEWDRNDLVFNPKKDDKPFQSKPKAALDLRKLAENLA
jgi:phage terminase large subunit GpA-like protein